MKTNSEILKTFNCPEQAVKHNGVWMWPEEIDVPKDGDIRWSQSAQSPCWASPNCTDIFLIFRAIPLPPKPTPEQLAKLTPAGKIATLGEAADCESVPWITIACDGIRDITGQRDDWDLHGLRWPVTLTDAPKEQVKPTDPRFIGLNPAKVSMDVLATMPEGARLLESEDERLAFERALTFHQDLFVFDRQDKEWVMDSFGNGHLLTYCTTRPRGWWKVKAEPVAVDMPCNEAWLTMIEEELASVKRRVEALEKK